MTSQINPNNIDGTYPVAGQDNSSQGFRDNFTSTKQNFVYAYEEISALQANAVLRGQTNEMADSIIANVALKGDRRVTYDLGTVTGPQTFVFGNGSYQTMTLGGSVVLSFSGFPTLTSRALSIFVHVAVPDTNYTLTWPAAVSTNLTSIAGQSSQVTSFAATGTYLFELITIDSGTSWNIIDHTRNRTTIQGGLTLQTVVANATVNGITMTVANIGGTAVGNITATNFIGNFITAGNDLSLTGNLTANNVIANTCFIGNICTPIQTGITLVGTLTSLDVSGNANVGNLTVTGFTDMCGGTGYGVQYSANAANGGSTQIWSNVGFCLIYPNAAISSHTILMPDSPMNGQKIQIAFANTITTLTQAGSGSQTVKGAYTTANADVGGTWIYATLADTWYKVG